jgi:hypothetical protein
MSRQLGLHHKKLRSRTHAGHSIFTQSARSSTPLNPFSPPDNAGELCQFVTAGPSPNTDGPRALHAGSGLSQTCHQARRPSAGKSASEIRAPVVLLGDATSVAGLVEASADFGRLVSN